MFDSPRLCRGFESWHDFKVFQKTPGRAGGCQFHFLMHANMAAPHYPSDVAFTPAVKAVQTAKHSRDLYANVEAGHGWETTVTDELAEFIGQLDMFYFATANADGQPYVQYKGGRPGFLKVIDEHTLGWADFAGNQQYISLGNLSENPKALIYLMDYVDQRRVKIWGRARVVEDDPALVERLRDKDYKPGKVQRAIVFDVEAWDMNCSQHIHRRFPQAIVGPLIEKLQGQIRELESKLSATSKQHL